MSINFARFGNGGWVIAIFLPLLACDPFAVTMLGVGANAGITHQLNGHVFKTFTEPRPRVQQATEAALARMGIAVVAKSPYSYGDRIRARAGDRDIDIDIESLTPTATRVKVVARREIAIILDAATAREIIIQTEKQLAAAEKPLTTVGIQLVPAEVQVAPVELKPTPVEVEFPPAGIRPSAEPPGGR